MKTTTKLRKATQKRVKLIRGKIRLVLNLRKNVDAHTKIKANLFHLHCRFSEVYAEITSMNNAEPCTSLTNPGKAPQKKRTNSTNHTFLSKRAVWFPQTRKCRIIVSYVLWRNTYGTNGIWRGIIMPFTYPNSFVLTIRSHSSASVATLDLVAGKKTEVPETATTTARSVTGRGTVSLNWSTTWLVVIRHLPQAFVIWTRKSNWFSGYMPHFYILSTTDYL